MAVLLPSEAMNLDNATSHLWFSYGFLWFSYGFPPFCSWKTGGWAADLRAPTNLAGDVGPDPATTQQLAGDVKETIFLGSCQKWVCMTMGYCIPLNGYLNKGKMIIISNGFGGTLFSDKPKSSWNWWNKYRPITLWKVMSMHYGLKLGHKIGKNGWFTKTNLIYSI